MAAVNRVKYSIPEAHGVSVGQPPLPPRVGYEPGVPAGAET